jgi:hypothetical protein
MSAVGVWLYDLALSSSLWAAAAAAAAPAEMAAVA